LDFYIKGKYIEESEELLLEIQKTQLIKFFARQTATSKI